VAILIT